MNSQVGENLVTNPDDLTVPEELLLSPRNPRHDRLIQPSNQVDVGAPVLSEAHRTELRRCLRATHKGFQPHYGAGRGDAFAMEVEFKITRDGRLSIKQARPWVHSLE